MRDYYSTLRKKREPKWLSYESHLVVCNSALFRAPFWCHPSKESRFRAKKKGPIWLFFSPNMIMKNKNGSPPQKRADFKNYSPREPFWLSFFSQCIHFPTQRKTHKYLCANYFAKCATKSFR